MTYTDTSKPNLFTRLQLKIAAARFFTVALLIHVLLVITGGSVVIFKSHVEPPDLLAPDGGFMADTDNMAAPPAPEPEEVIPEQNFTPTVNSAPVPVMSAIASTSLDSSFTLSTDTNTIPTVAPVADVGKQLAGVENMVQAAAAAGTRRMTASLFGKKVETNKLGIILDVSGSLHGRLPDVMNEITSKFAEASTVLVFGCGMKPAFKGKIVALKNVKIEDTDSGTNSIRGAYTRIASFREHYDRMKQRSDAWYVFPAEASSISPKIVGAHEGFEHLLSEKVDTIYWFSDLKDSVDPKIAERLGRKMRSRKVTLIVHQPDPAGVTPDPGQKILFDLTNATIINGFAAAAADPKKKK